MTANRNARARRVRSASAGRTLTEWLPLWLNELGARGNRPRTLDNHEKVMAQLVKGVGDINPRDITPEALEAWRDELRSRLKASSVNSYLLKAGTFFNWLVEEGDLPESPVMSVALVPDKETAPPVLSQDNLRALMAAASETHRGRGKYEAVRDVAMLSLLIDTGLRASECAGLLLENLNLNARQVFVHEDVSKGGYSARTVTFGFKTAQALARYLKMRDEHRYRFYAELWLGRHGPINGKDGVYEVVKGAARRAGIVGKVHPHLLRHTWTDDMKRSGVNDEVTMALGGWSTTAMLRRYGRAEKTARAIEAYQRLGSPLDRSAKAGGARKGATHGVSNQGARSASG